MAYGLPDRDEPWVDVPPQTHYRRAGSPIKAADHNQLVDMTESADKSATKAQHILWGVIWLTAINGILFGLTVGILIGALS